MTITYETAKKLKEFLGKEVPEPIEKDNGAWGYKKSLQQWVLELYWKGDIPAYQLHDLLSKPFCEAMAEKVIRIDRGYGFVRTGHGIHCNIASVYWHNGLSAVEKELLRMMEGK